MNHKKFGVLGLILLFFPLLNLLGAEITVPKLELATRGASEDGEFAFSSNAAADIALNGGYKYGILLGLSFEAANLGKAFAYRNFRVEPMPAGVQPNADDFNGLADRYNNQASLSFRIAKATARDLFNLPLELSYFIGLGDAFCSGEEFALRYGISDVGTDFTGFYYFPEGIGGNPYRRYNGLHSVQGTGFSFALTKWENVLPMFYVYQNIPLIDGMGYVDEKIRFSGDFRILFNHERLRLEAYAGMSGGKYTKPEVRGGALAFFSSGQGADFLLECGVPGYISDDDFSIDNLYFLFEPRLDFGLLALHTTFFYHPLEYLHIKTEEERGKADINIKLLIGDLPESSIQGGFEATMGLKINGMEEYSLKLSPFISFLSDGLRWDLKLRIDPLAGETPEKIVEIFAGIRTAY
jgi:hypothetical protein